MNKPKSLWRQLMDTPLNQAFKVSWDIKIEKTKIFKYIIPCILIIVVCVLIYSIFVVFTKVFTKVMTNTLITNSTINMDLNTFTAGFQTVIWFIVLIPIALSIYKLFKAFYR